MKIRYPLATVAPHGPDDRTVTKLAVGIIRSEQDEETSALHRWGGTNVASDKKVAREMFWYMRDHGVKTVATATAVLGCPHEEGNDFPSGEDCPFCPFWKSKQGSKSDRRWQDLKSLRIERLGISYRFWLP
jgi:hypothetical protein